MFRLGLSGVHRALVDFDLCSGPLGIVARKKAPTVLTLRVVEFKFCYWHLPRGKTLEKVVLPLMLFLVQFFIKNRREHRRFLLFEKQGFFLLRSREISGFPTCLQHEQDC